MNNSAIDIDALVRQVIAELTARKSQPQIVSTQKTDAQSNLAKTDPQKSHSTPNKPEQQTATTTKTTVAPPSPAKTGTHTNGELFIDAKVITKNDVLGRLDAVRRLIVPEGAIVTPAVQDDLIRRGITLERAKANAKVEQLRLILITMGTDFEPEKLAAVLTREGVKVEVESMNCIIAATEKLAGELQKSNTLGVLLTKHTAAALCLANRLAGIRAVTGFDAATTAAAAAAVGANMLVIDPRFGTFFQLKQITSEFCRAGVRACPEVYKSKLG